MAQQPLHLTRVRGCPSLTWGTSAQAWWAGGSGLPRDTVGERGRGDRLSEPLPCLARAFRVGRGWQGGRLPWERPGGQSSGCEPLGPYLGPWVCPWLWSHRGCLATLPEGMRSVAVTPPACVK